MEIKWSYDHLVSTMKLNMFVKWHIYIESGPCLNYPANIVFAWNILGLHWRVVTSKWKINVSTGYLRLICISYAPNQWNAFHNDIIKWKHFPRNWPFVQGIHRSPVNSLHKGQWHRALMFSFIWALNKRLSKRLWVNIVLIMTSL